MSLELLASIALILVGTFTIAVSLRLLRGVLDALPLVSQPHRSWLRRLIRAHRSLMLFFLFGYLATAAAFALDWHLVGRIFVGLVFAMGALFVYLGVTIQTRLVGEILTTMERLVPICANCKRIRHANRNPYDIASWTPVEAYFAEAHQTQFTHGLCPDCTAKFFPE